MAPYSLIFKGNYDNNREIAKIENLTDTKEAKTDKEILSEAQKVIQDFCAVRNFKIHYMRIWNHEGITIFDVGSYSEFFHLIPELDIEKIYIDGLIESEVEDSQN